MDRVSTPGRDAERHEPEIIGRLTSAVPSNERRTPPQLSPAYHLVDCPDDPILIGFSQDFQQPYQTPHRHRGDIQRIGINGLTLYR
nr:hypothetical protein [uncultured Rhodopila sp.]